MWYKFITKLIIPLTCTQYDSLKERKRGRFSRSVHASLLHGRLSCNKLIKDGEPYIGGSDKFFFGGEHATLNLLTCEILHTYTSPHTSGLHTQGHIHSSKTINCHWAVYISEMSHSRFEILQNKKQLFLP